MKASFVSLLLIIMFPLFSLSAETEPVFIPNTPEEKPVLEKIEEAAKNIRFYRGNTRWTLMGNYSLLDLWVPLKFGVSVAYNPNRDYSYELEYLRGKFSRAFYLIEVGAITDQRISLIKRSFAFRNSFNYLYGINYSTFSVRLGNEYLATTNNPGVVDLAKVETLGLTWGLGHRWQTARGITWGFDWFVINWPIKVLNSSSPFLKSSNDQNKRDDVQKVLSFFENVPSFATVKIQLGYSF